MNDEHSYMYDEIVNVIDFNIEMPEENDIKQNIGKCKVFILTGDAGEGKSRIIRNLKGIFDDNNYKITPDFSELQNAEKEEVLLNVEKALFVGDIPS